MGLPPLLLPGVQVPVRLLFVVVSLVFWESLGVFAAMVYCGAVSVPVPIALVALTVRPYSVPFVSPVTLQVSWVVVQGVPVVVLVPCR